MTCLLLRLFVSVRHGSLRILGLQVCQLKVRDFAAVFCSRSQ